MLKYPFLLLPTSRQLLRTVSLRSHASVSNTPLAACLIVRMQHCLLLLYGSITRLCKAKVPCIRAAIDMHPPRSLAMLMIPIGFHHL
jgi:hypothetical protein